jgi:integrase
MAHKPFNLHRRITTKGKKTFYVQFYNDAGRRMNAMSTGMSSKSAAESWAFAYIQEGKTGTKRTLGFTQYSQNFFVWGKCPYIESQIARGQPISRGYADALRSYLANHILPSFRSYKLVQITPKDVEDWLLRLRTKIGRNGRKLSPTTINQCLNALRIILSEAARLGLISNNPALSIKQLKRTPETRGVLTIQECKRLFDESLIEKIWGGDLRHYSISLLAASTGMRLGEIQGLQRQHLTANYVQVEHSYTRKYGLSMPKRNSRRVIPIPSRTSAHLQELVSLSPYRRAKDLIFFGTRRDRAIERKVVEEKLYAALGKIGISEELRKQRNVTFHSWRHFFNSYLRTKIPDAKLQRLTGHKTLEMTDHYTHFNLEDYEDVLLVQEEMLRLEPKPPAG